MRSLGFKQRGIGLIELMISITLGLFLLAGAIGVLVSSKVSYNLNNELTWIQDNARFASTVLNRDMRMAGFFGCSSSQGFTSALNPVGSGTGWYLDFDNPVSGWDGDDATYPSSEFPAAYNSASAPGLPTSDTVSLRRASDTNYEVVNNTPVSSARIETTLAHPFVAGDILAITDCDQTTIFQVTGVSGSDIRHSNSGGSPGNCTIRLGNNECNTTAANNKSYFSDEGAFVVQIKSHAYYVSTGGDGTPTLFRRELATNAGNAEVADEELVQGVENIQVSYGYDATGDGYANRYTDADDLTASQWPNVVTLRINLLLRSFSPVASEPQTFRFVGNNYTPTDNFLRQEFISTIELRNRG